MTPRPYDLGDVEDRRRLLCEAARFLWEQVTDHPCPHCETRLRVVTAANHGLGEVEPRRSPPPCSPARWTLTMAVRKLLAHGFKTYGLSWREERLRRCYVALALLGALRFGMEPTPAAERST